MSSSTIHYSEFRPLAPDHALAEEWETYRREVGRLLAEGHEGRHVLIKGAAIIGPWDTFEAAQAEGLKRFLRQPHLIKQVRTQEPLLKVAHGRLWKA